MNTISTLGTYAVDYSGQREREISGQSEPQNIETGDVVSITEKSVIQTVDISQEALAKFQAYTEEQKADDTASHPLRTAEGAAVVQRGPMSEEEQAALIEASATVRDKFITEYLTELDKVWTHLSTVTKQIDQTFSSFLDQLAKDHPDLKDVFFGFSVNKDGTLFVTQADGLNKEQMTRLNQALNDDDDLVSQANELADAQIAAFEVHDGFNTKKTFNRDNYAQTIDMGIDLLTRYLARSAPHDETAVKIHQRNWNTNWYNQL